MMNDAKMTPLVYKVDSDKSWLVDIPVSVMIWTRPVLQREQFEVLRKARPSVLFLISDGGRNNHETALIAESRAVFDDIDWHCTVHKLFWDSNQGMYSVSRLANSYKWKNADRMILLEDDIIPSVSYFRFCKEMLDKYEDDLRVLGVCGMNHEGVTKGTGSDYIFSREASIWGMAIWRRTFENRNFNYSGNDYALKTISESARLNPDFQNRLRGYANNDVYEGHMPSSEFWYAFDVFAQNQLYIVPTKNLISNKGCTSNAAHSAELKILPKGIQRVFNMDIYELEFPLKEPQFITPDIRYQNAVYRIMGVGHPLVRTHRRMSRALRILRYQGVSRLFSKLKGAVNRAES